MGLDRRRVLETSLFDSEQIVTVQYLSRHADIPIDDAKNELAEFLQENKDRTELHAVYLLSGELKTSNLVGSKSDIDKIGDKTVSCNGYHTQLVRDCDLEEARKAYSEVNSCDIYCLHTKPIKSLCLLYSVDSLDDAEYVRTDPERSWLSYPEADVKRNEMLEQYGAVPKSETPEESGLQKKPACSTSKSSEPASSTSKSSEPAGSTSKPSEPAVKKKKNDIASMFAQAAVQNIQKGSLPKESTSQKVEKDVVEKANTKSDQSVRRRGQRIAIDDEEEEEKEVKKGSEISEKKNIMTKSTEMVTSKKTETNKAPRNDFLTQEDLFSAGDSSPERMDLDETEEIEMKEEKEVPKESRLPAKDDGSENGTTQESQKKMTRKEYVTETFLDDDGFMVTKEVLKEIEVQQPSTTEEHSKVTSSVKLLGSKGRKNMKIPQGQAKISSFFQKK